VFQSYKLIFPTKIFIFIPAVLGNHDYRGDVEAQLSPILRQKDSRWVCLRSFILDAGINPFKILMHVEFWIFHRNKLVYSEFLRSSKKNYIQAI
jgi:hypothetical protein